MNIIWISLTSLIIHNNPADSIKNILNSNNETKQMHISQTHTFRLYVILTILLHSNFIKTFQICRFHVNPMTPIKSYGFYDNQSYSIKIILV